ncbi:MAG TPA: helix-hairpin-helix domain-containing protein [Rhodoferax sp.]|nr:helix-hairpin-helix domain-containing protein [Rhodoferax sp.]
MTIRTIKSLVASAVLLLTLGSAFSAEQKVANTNPAGTSEKPAVTASNPAVKKTIAAPKARLVDINSAGPNELKTLPGVTADVAERIIAARPFGSKAQLTTRGIVPRELYEDLKGLVVAKQNPETTAKLLKK